MADTTWRCDACGESRRFADIPIDEACECGAHGRWSPNPPARDVRAELKSLLVDALLSPNREELLVWIAASAVAVLVDTREPDAPVEGFTLHDTLTEVRARVVRTMLEGMDGVDADTERPPPPVAP